ncbi:MAG: MraY family glycosyltransferase [Planctomycetota bacterium]
MLAPVLLAGVGALVLSIVLTLIVRTLGRRRVLLDSAGSEGHAKELRAVPNIGGVAIFWSIALPIGLGLGIARVWPGVAEILPAVAEHLEGIREQTPMGLALLGCLLVLHVVGLVDDRRPLGPLIKLGVMLGTALVMTWGFDARLLEMLDQHVGGSWLSIVITVLWFAAVTNAMNFIDNMDGIAAGIGVVAGSFFLAAAALGGQWFVAAALAVLVGSLLGFLLFNKPRATIFMGDGGSLVLGFLLAFLTVRTTYLGGPLGSAGYAVFMPLCVLAVPLYDLVAVTVIRLSQGRSPMVGDQQHLTHRLRARGLSDWQVLAVLCGGTAVTGIGGVLLGQLDGWRALLIGVQTLLVLLVLAMYEFASTRREVSA